MKHVVTTSLGQYVICEDTDNNKGIKIYSVDGKPLFGSTKVEWWDLDGIEKVIIENIEMLNKREAFLSV